MCFFLSSQTTLVLSLYIISECVYTYMNMFKLESNLYECHLLGLLNTSSNTLLAELFLA